MKEYKVIVFQDKNKCYWYTLEQRRIYFLLRGNWKRIKPTMQTSYKRAIALIKPKF